MLASQPFVSALYNDVKQRLPLWSTTVDDSFDHGTTVAITSRCTSSESKVSVKVFFAVEANASPAITPEVVSQWVRLVDAAYSAEVATDVQCYLCFIDAAGSVSYYACETAGALF